MTDSLPAKDYENACLLVGRFMYYFALLEGQLNDGIGKLLGLGNLENAIATANMPLRSKIHILKSVVNLKGGSSEWVKVLQEVADFSTIRNTVAHTVFGPEDGGGVRFLAIKAKTKLAFPNTVWSEQDFFDHCKKARELTQSVRKIVDAMDPKPQGINALLAQALTESVPTAAHRENSQSEE